MGVKPTTAKAPSDICRALFNHPFPDQLNPVNVVLIVPYVQLALLVSALERPLACNRNSSPEETSSMSTSPSITVMPIG